MKYLIITRDDYNRMLHEIMELKQREEDMFKGNRCAEYRTLAAEVRCLRDSIDQYQKVLQAQDKEIKQYRNIIHDLCSTLVTPCKEE